MNSDSWITKLVLNASKTPGTRQDHFSGSAAVFYCELFNIPLKDNILNKDKRFIEIIGRHLNSKTTLETGIFNMLQGFKTLI